MSKSHTVDTGPDEKTSGRRAARFSLRGFLRDIFSRKEKMNPEAGGRIGPPVRPIEPKPGRFC